jgi:hypothetical protein
MASTMTCSPTTYALAIGLAQGAVMIGALLRTVTLFADQIEIRTASTPALPQLPPRLPPPVVPCPGAQLRHLGHGSAGVHLGADSLAAPYGVGRPLRD